MQTTRTQTQLILAFLRQRREELRLSTVGDLHKASGSQYPLKRLEELQKQGHEVERIYGKVDNRKRVYFMLKEEKEANSGNE